MAPIPVRIAGRDPGPSTYITKVANPRGVPKAGGAPVVAKQTARLLGGYTGGTFRQRNPPPVAYLNNLARTWTMPWAIRQRLVAPADQTEIYVSDPRGILGKGEWQQREDYFRNLSVRGLGGVRTNPERTAAGRGLWGKPYQPAGNTMRFLPSPGDASVDTNDTEMPLRRGY